MGISASISSSSSLGSCSPTTNAYNYFQRADGGLQIRDFLIARFARIYPVYLLSVILFVPPGLFGAVADPITAFISAVTLSQTWTGHMAWNTPGWSLSVEAFFYLLFPLILLLLARLRVAGLLVTMTTVWVVGLIGPALWALGIIPNEHTAAKRATRGVLASRSSLLWP